MQTCNHIELKKSLFLDSPKFGQIEYANEDIIKMISPIYGFGELQNFILTGYKGSFDLLYLLASSENKDISFILIDLKTVFNRTDISLSDYDLASLKVKDIEELNIYGILTIPVEPLQTTVNMKAPIFINRSLQIGKQIILAKENLSIRTLLSTLKC